MMDRGHSDIDPRRFGLIFAAGLATLSTLLFWRARPLGPYILGLALFIALLAVAIPRALVPLERVLAKIVRWVSAGITYTVLALMYYLVITPMALVIRLLGQDLLEMKIDPETESYWKKVEPSGPGSRPDQPY